MSNALCSIRKEVGVIFSEKSSETENKFQRLYQFTTGTGSYLRLLSDQQQQCWVTSGNPLFSIVLEMWRGTGGSGVHMQMETSSDHAAAIVFPRPFPSQTRLEKWHPVGYNSVGDHHFTLTSALKCGSCLQQYYSTTAVTVSQQVFEFCIWC